jgi:hypothetical protein
VSLAVVFVDASLANFSLIFHGKSTNITPKLFPLLPDLAEAKLSIPSLTTFSGLLRLPVQ